MKATKIPYLHCRNGIYYYRNQSVWKSLKTRCKKEAFKKLSYALFGTTPVLNDTSSRHHYTPIRISNTKLTIKDTIATLPCTSRLITASLTENGNRWWAREYIRIKCSLKFLPKGFITQK
jgi:hypothetical protein